MWTYQPQERRGGQASVTITGLWALHGPVDPMGLLTGIDDPPPAASQLRATDQVGPVPVDRGAAPTTTLLNHVDVI